MKKFIGHEQEVPEGHELIKSCCGRNHQIGAEQNLHDFCCNTSEVVNISYDDDPKYVTENTWDCGCKTWSDAGEDA